MVKTWFRPLAAFAVAAVLLPLNAGSVSAGAREKYDEAVASWLGADISRVVRAWGPPTNTFTSPNGEVTYTWISANGTTVTAEAKRELFGPATHVTAQSRERSCRTSLTVGTLNDTGLWVFQNKDDKIVLAASIDAPAGQAGIRIGDVVLAVDGVSTKGMSHQEFSRRVDGPSGTSVQMTIKRKKVKESLEFTVKRDTRMNRVITYSWQGYCF